MARILNVDILGAPVHDVTYAEACDVAEQLIQQGGAHQFATVNPEFIMAARRDAEFMRVLHHTALNVPDGAGVLWAARRKGVRLRQRVAGVDLVQKLCAMASTHGWRAYFLGAQPGVAERAAAAMALAYPGLMVAGAFAGSPRPEDEMAIVERVRAASPHLLFVAYGAPAQDKWLARNLPIIAALSSSSLEGARVSILNDVAVPMIAAPSGSPLGAGGGILGMGVGGAFDFIVGVQRRAPEWMQRAGLEWLYRLMRDPGRWRRQMALAGFAVAAIRDARIPPNGRG